MNYSKPIYSVLLIYIPLSVIVLFSPVPGLIYRFFMVEQIIDFREWYWFIFSFLSVLASVVYVTVLKKDFYVRMVDNFRASMFVAIFVYVLSSLFQLERGAGLTVMQRLSPSPNTLGSVIVSMYGWFSVIFLQKTFRGIELFSSFTAKYEKDQLQEQVRDFAPEMSSASLELKGLMKSYGMEFIPGCLILTATGYYRSSVLLTVLVFLIFCTGFLIMGFFGLQRRELAYASEGIHLTIRDRALPIPIIGIGIAAAMIVGFIGSSDNSLLTPELALSILMGIGRFLSSLMGGADPADLAMLQQGGGFGPSNQVMEAVAEEAGEYSTFESFRYIRYAVIAALISLFVLFLIYPLLKKETGTFNPKNIFVSLKQWFINLRNDIKAFFAALGQKEKSIRIEDREKIEEIVKKILPGKHKSRELRQSVTLFARLILWGIETLSVPWKPSLAPGEYCLLMTEALEKTADADTESSGYDSSTTIETKTGILRSAFLFEKSLYSPRPLSGAEENEYRTLVEGIIAG